MVTSVTSFGRSGLSDWLVQRVTAVIMAVYFVFLMGYLMTHPQLDFASWKALHSITCMKIFNTLALLSAIAHAWIGIWAVLTDYVTTRLLGDKGTVMRVLLQVAAVIVLAIYTLWGLSIVWGV